MREAQIQLYVLPLATLIVVVVGIMFSNARMTDLNHRLGDLNLNINKRFDDLRADTFAHLDALRADMLARFDDSNKRFDDL